ncbi:MAG: hypothetical protein KDJ88_08040 [Bauldia sp.]|nr:hypothetical protein [Bauldia sp.]
MLILAARIAPALFAAGSAVAAGDATPSSHPLLKPYSDWVNAHVSSEFARNWRIFPGGDDREPYLVYCKDELFAEDAIRGKSVRVRAGSQAEAFFSKITGKSAVYLPSSEINVALELDIIDCIGFGGEILDASATAKDDGPKPVDTKEADAGAPPDSLLTLPQDLDDF